MNDRDELAELVREQFIHDTSNRWTMNLVDAILARWRLVPIERDLPGPDWDGPNITRGSAEARFPILTDDDEPLAYDDELPWDNQAVRHFNTTAERDTHTMLRRTPGMIVKVGGEYHTWTGQQWAAQPAQPDPSPE